MTRILVCGGRDYDQIGLVHRVLDQIAGIGDCIITGGASGADTLAFQWAYNRGVATMVFQPQWHWYGKMAGPVRNQWMIDHGMPGLVLAFPGGKGTSDMVDRARKANIKVIEVS